MFNLLAIDGFGGGTPPIHTTPDPQHDMSISTVVYIIFGLFLISIFIIGVIYAYRKPSIKQKKYSEVNCPNETIGNKEQTSPEITSEEQALLDDFRSLPRQERVQACTYIRYLADQNKNKNA